MCAYNQRICFCLWVDVLIAGRAYKRQDLKAAVYGMCFTTVLLTVVLLTSPGVSPKRLKIYSKRFKTFLKLSRRMLLER